MCPDTVQQLEMSESGICTGWTQANVSGHCATMTTGQKCRNQVFLPIGLRPMCPDTLQQFYSGRNVGIGYLNRLDSGQCVQTLNNNSEDAKMFNSGICINCTGTHVSGHCATIIIGQICRNQVFDPDGLGPMCPDTEQQF